MVFPPPLGTQNIGYTYGDANLGQMPDQIYKVSWNGQDKIDYTYDGLGRLTNKSVLVGGGDPDAPKLNNIYTYQDVGTDKTTTLVQSVQTAAGTYTYTYDAVGNILSVSDGTYTNSYVYDSLNQLVRENNQKFGKTYTYTYVNGNITERQEYAYTTGELGTPQCVYNWSYGDSTWSDLLTDWGEGAASTANASSVSAFSLQSANTNSEKILSVFERTGQNTSNSSMARSASTASAESTTDTTQTIFYDEIGNPTEIFGLQFSWNGRQLTEIAVPDDPYCSNIAYAYNMDGQRISKTLTASDGTATTTEYFYNGSILAGEKTGDTTVVYMYDNNGDIFGFTVDGRAYYYVKNAQNDVTAIADSVGNLVVEYYYDAWGEAHEHFLVSGQARTDVENNPILYRSYYLDRETGFYYLNTRYYVPMFCRFLNADGIIGANQDLISFHTFAYCGNNPVNRNDPSGYAWYHWAIATAIVVGCAVAVVATAGGAAAGIAAVVSVASGYAASTAAATVAAGAFIGASTALGVAAIGASMNSSSAKDFANQGNWGTVAVTAGGAALGAVGGYGLSSGAKKTPVIGKMRDLNKTRININEFKVADLLPDQGSPKANWQQNASVLRTYLDGRAVKDVSPYPMENAGFLGAERNLLINYGYVYENGYWIMP